MRTVPRRSIERDVEAVLNDVRNGGVNLKRAREIYGVVIDERSMTVDMAATERRREEMKHVPSLTAQ